MTDTSLIVAGPRSANPLNPLKHGLHAQPIILPSETENEWTAFVAETLDHYAPETAIERALALRIAELFWRLRRAARAERNDILESETSLDRREESRARRGMELEPREPGGALPTEKVLNAVMRYEAHLNRQLFQTMHELEAMQLRRSGGAAPLARVQVHQDAPE